MSNKSIVELCIIPAAGKGSRWAPVSGYLPKEMLPLVDKPVIDWVIEEAVHSGIKTIIVVINKHKKVIKDYLLKNKNFNKKVKLIFVNQENPLGISHAILLCDKYIGDNGFTVALPDLPTLSKKPVLKQLMEAYELTKGSAHIISFNQFPTDTLHQYTECLLELRKDKLLDIQHYCPKSPDHKPHHPGNKLRMSGRYVFLPELVPVIKQIFKNFKGDEVKEFDALYQAGIKGQKILGISINGHTYDTGTPNTYVRANTAFFKKKLSRRV